MLSTRLGYLRPARFACALAEAFALGVSFVDFFRGLGFSHGLDDFAVFDAMRAAYRRAGIFGSDDFWELAHRTGSLK
jgi:hypothetical protein